MPSIQYQIETTGGDRQFQTNSALGVDLAESIPSLDCFWNPGPETHRERFKLKALHTTAQASGILRHVFGRLANRSIGILTYHRITDLIAGVSAPTINVTPAAFRSQLQGLKDRGFQFASLKTVLDARENGAELKERTVVVTFDDIYDNVFVNALPVLQELEIPATVFVSTAFVDFKKPFPFDPWAQEHLANVPESAWQPISSQHLEEMLSTGLIELGAHTHTHQDFRDRPTEFAADVARGVASLQTQFGATRLPFAFPYGSPRGGFCSEVMMNAVQELGLRCGLSTGPQTNPTASSPFGWGRFHVFEHDTPGSLAAKLDGWYEWLPKLKNRLTRGRSQSQQANFEDYVAASTIDVGQN